MPTEPEVRIENAFRRPLDNAVAAARTCYSSRGIVTPDEVGGAGLLDPEEKRKRREARDRIARSVYQAGHHTTLQHAQIQFALSGVSRLFLWSFLHSHTFYNSEQVSQRYVEVKPGSHYLPDLPPSERAVYEGAIEAQMAAYRRLCELLAGPVEREYLAIYPGRRGKPRAARDVPKRAQEAARYVLPVATLAFLYHTVSAITLLRYWRLARSLDVPDETRRVVGAMVRALTDLDPDFALLLEEPIPLESTPEHEALARFHGAGRPDPAEAARFRAEFDAALGGRTSILVGRAPENVALVAGAVREVLGLARARLSDARALELALDPARNRTLGEALNLGDHSKLTRCLHHAHYTFKKKLSHAADSQDQRHRLTPGSRPVLVAHLGEEPDVVVPPIVAGCPPAADCWREAMDGAWAAMRKLSRAGVAPEVVQYLLPNAAAVRFTESSDLLALHHKMAMRLCYLAQEEIWRASLDEALAISEVEPEIGRHLAPPCTLRHRAGQRPCCPEGDRFCGVVVWRLEPVQYQRAL